MRPISTPRAALLYIARHGIVPERTRAGLPGLVEAIVGAPVRGSWWAHPDGKRIFRVLGAVNDSPDILRCRLVDAKVTYAHRRTWPALVRLAPRIGARRLDRHVQEHTATGAHRDVTTPFPDWVPAGVRAEARSLGDREALEALKSFGETLGSAARGR
jgi:hypothetical protein